MPIYEYKCQECGYQFEKFQSFSDKPLNKCPKCKKKRIKKILHAPSIVFKGKGWYSTDSRPKKISKPKTRIKEKPKKEEVRKKKKPVQAKNKGQEDCRDRFQQVAT